MHVLSKTCILGVLAFSSFRPCFPCSESSLSQDAFRDEGTKQLPLCVCVCVCGENITKFYIFDNLDFPQFLHRMCLWFFCMEFYGFLGFVIMEYWVWICLQIGILFFPNCFVVCRPFTRMQWKTAFIGSAYMALPLVYKSSPCPTRLPIWLSLYKQRSRSTLFDVLYFNPTIDAWCHWNGGGQVYVPLSFPHFFTYCTPILV